MKRTDTPHGFALALTLVLMALIVIVVVAYLSSTRIERSTSSLYANRLRAKITADSALAAAVHLLRDNTRYGNYITAMPAPSPSPTSIYTEVYRPTDPADPSHAKADDYLQLNNGNGELLISLALPTPIPGSSPFPLVDPRPTPAAITTPLPAGSPFALPNLSTALSSSNSYDFNQIVRVGASNAGRLVDPSGRPALGQWVNVRNAANPPEIIGRYAFFIEDESMKVNVNVTGNNLGSSSAPNVRVNDLLLAASPTPAPTPSPASQIQEMDPSGVLPTTGTPPPDRIAAIDVLTNAGAPGSRFTSKGALAVLAASPSPTPDQWQVAFPSYAHLITVLSKDDNTTARGWQRMDLNALVASATDNTSKIGIAQRIANWIRDAWTGPPLAGLLDYQMFNDERLRLQLAANIIDYIDADNTPTDLGNYPSIGVFPPNPAEYPVIGIEKIPYLAAVEIIYQASNSNGTSAATLKMKIQFRFLNLYEADVDLASTVGRIELKGVPIVQRNVPPPVFDVSTTNYVIPLASLTPVTPGNGTIVPAGTNGTGDSGARTFQTGWLEDRSVTFNGAGNVKPVLLAGSITFRVFGLGGERLDDTAVATNLISTGYNQGSGGSTGDFLKDATPGPLQTASINLIDAFPAGGTGPVTTGDPRVRGPILNGRWYNISRSDASTPAGTNRIDQFIDKAEIASRTYAVDWYDSIQVRPLAFHRNSAMLNIGELGNVSAGEYPWRTLYFQYSERPVNSTQVGPVTEVPLRRNNAVDYILTDLFRTQAVQPRLGAININTQQRVSSRQHALNSLFLGLAAGTLTVDQTQTEKIAVDPNSTPIPAPAATPPIYSIFQKRAAVSPPSDNTPVRPFFQIGELASLLSRLVNSSIRVAGETRSTVTYSILRSNPTQAADVIADYRSDMLAEQEFRGVSNSVTTRGNIFRVLYVGQALKNGITQAEYLGEAFIERDATFEPESSNPDALKTSDSTYKMVVNHAITE